ncbi:glycosyltransferase family 2 protein [Bradyrhizobium roseum]|uniref:glycosyltransferase family 2 protein n=1 Tax=Bradyrhizobium roseum TaxID=3056648 RepID=UPI00262A8A5C|nr:glycosyltransferase family 2 protein [Bradyrhizobium roseus]WKA30644.1 glycosyltransferase family 2 protein [Bradyrhizobium roseus]
MLILVAMAGLLSVPVAVLLVEVIAALKAPRLQPFEIQESEVQESNAGKQVVVIVPAHNESSGLVPTLQDIKAQLGVRDRLIVVADNCTDDTPAVAAASGAEVIARDDPERIGKGFAMGWGITHLRQDPPDFVLFVDADCRLGDDFIGRLKQVCQGLQRPVQALFVMQSPDDSPVNHSFAEFAWLLKNQVRPLGLRNLHCPVQLMGTGMMFPWNAINSVSLESSHLVEDLKLGLDLAAAGQPPYFFPFVKVTSVFPTSAKGTESQRLRWVQGHLATIGKFVPRLLATGLMRRDVNVVVLALDLLVPPLSLLALLIVATLALTSLVALLGGPWLPSLIAGGNLVGFILCILLAWSRFGRQVFPAREVLSAGSFALRKIGLYRRMLTGGAASQWIRTDRSTPN